MDRSELRDVVILNIGGRTDKNTLIDTAFNLCLSDKIVQRHAFKDCISQETVAIDTGVDEAAITLPSGTWDVLEARIIDDTSSVPLDIKEKKWITDRNPNPEAEVTAKPSQAYKSEGKLFLIPWPDSNYDVYLTVVTKPTMGAAEDADPTIDDLDSVLISFATYYAFLSDEKFISATEWEKRFERDLLEAIVADQKKPHKHLAFSDGRDRDVPSGTPWLDPFVKKSP